MTETTQWVRVRRLAHVANSLLTKNFPITPGPQYGDAKCSPIAIARYPRAFRRAFVEAKMMAPFRIESISGCHTFFCGDKRIAMLNRHGELLWFAKTISPISLAPGNINNLVMRADCLEQTLQRRYETIVWEGLHDPDHELDLRFHVGGFCFSQRRVLRGQAINAVKAFCTAMDPERLRALRRSGMFNVAYRLVAVQTTSRRFGSRWLQAIAAYPVLLRWVFGISNEQDPAMWPDAAAVATAINEGRPLIPALANALRISEATVRRFHGVTPQRTGRLPSTSALHFIAALPPHLRPAKRADYAAAYALHRQLSCFTKDERDDNTLGVLDMASLTKGMKLPLGDEHRIAALEGFVDVVNWLYRAVGFERRDMARTLIRAHLTQCSLGRLVELNAAWHRAHREATQLTNEALAREKEATTPAPEWPPLMPEKRLELGGGITAVELTSPADLLTEGAELKHCVSGYASFCYSGDSRIVSLRGANDVARSTIEFRQTLSADGLRVTGLYIEQHCAKHNDQPCDEDLSAASKLLRILNPIGAERAWSPVELPADAMTARLLNENMLPFLQRWFPEIAALPPPWQHRAAA